MTLKTHDNYGSYVITTLVNYCSKQKMQRNHAKAISPKHKRIFKLMPGNLKQQ